MNNIQSLLEKMLRVLGFKKFMWMHVIAYIIFVLMMLGQLIKHLLIGDWEVFYTNDIIILLLELTLVYIILRVFQALFERKIENDRFMYFWSKKNHNK